MNLLKQPAFSGILLGKGGYLYWLPYIKIATMKEAILSVFATCSSVATISLNLKYTKNLGGSEKEMTSVIFGTLLEPIRKIICRLL